MSFIGPALPPHLLPCKDDEDEDSDLSASCSKKESDLVGPVLPPHLLSHKDNPGEDSNKLQGHHSRMEINVVPVLPDVCKNAGIESDEDEEEENEDDLYGPALPPHLTRPKIIGPTLPPGVTLGQDESSDEDDEVVGPMPMPAGIDLATYMQQQVESRANRMMKKISDKNKQGKVERETWMVELPTNRSGLLGLEARSFRRSAGPDKNADTSAWTDTPEDKLRKEKSLQPVGQASSSAAELEEKVIRERDRAMAKRAAKHASKRGAESLVDIHQKKVDKRNKEAEKKQERRMFDREKDLQVNRFDEAQKKAVLNKAKLLDDRFSSGGQKYL